MRITKSVALALFLALVLPLAALGQPVNRIFPEAARDQVYNRYLVVYSTYWIDSQTEDVMGDIRGRLLDEKGSPLGGEFTISSAEAKVQTVQPTVAFSPEAGVYLVAWEDGRNGAGAPQTDIYAQLVNADGQCVLRATHAPGLDNFAVSTATADQSKPDLAYDPANQRFFCVFADNRSLANIYGQMITAAGAPFSTAVDVNFPVSTADSGQYEPAVAFDSASGRYLVVFEDQRNGVPDIYGQILASDGSPYSTTVSANFPVSMAASEQRLPSTDILAGAGRFLVAWEDYRNDPYDSDIFGQLVTSEGALYSTTVAENFPVSDAAWGQASPVVVADLGRGVFAVFFEDWREYADIYGQRVSPEGEALGTPTDENFLAAGPLDEWMPAAALGPDSFLVGYGFTDFMGLTQVTWTQAGLDLAPLADDAFLMGRWPMDEGAGLTAADVSGYGNDASLSNTAWATGPESAPGKALGFAGDSLATVGDADSLDFSTDFTLSLWVLPSDTVSTQAATLVKKAGIEGQYSFALEHSGSTVKFSVSVDGLVPGASAWAFDVLRPGRWTHLAASYDGFTLRLYVDGQPAGTAFLTGPMFQGTSALTFGGPDFFFHGAMDDARVYRKALTEDRILVLAGFTGLLTGTVSGPGGAPVANAGVEARALAGDRFFTAPSDSQGDYTLVLPPGCYRVDVFPPGSTDFQILPGRVVVVRDGSQGGTREDFNLLGGAFSVSGAVLVEGMAAPYAEVSYHGASGAQASTQSDFLGGFTLANLPPGPGLVRADWPSSAHASGATPVDLSANLTGVEIELPLGGTLSGRLADPDGTPIPGLRVRFEGMGPDQELFAVTGTDGRFVLGPLPPGMGMVQVKAEPGAGYVSSQEIPVALAPGDIRDLGTITVLPGAKVTGRVITPEGTPLPCGLTVESSGPGFLADAQVVNGYYTLVLPVGEHRVALDTEDGGQLSGASAYPVTATVAPADLPGPDPVQAPDMILFQGGEGGSLVVTPNAPGGWIPPATGELRVAVLASGTLPAPATLDGVLSSVTVNGAPAGVGTPCAVAPLPPGTYDVLLTWRDSGMEPDGISETVLDAALGVVVNAGEETALNLSIPGILASAHGTVMNDNGAPVFGVKVLVIGPDGSMAAIAMADAAGMYTVTGLPAALGGTAYAVTAGHPLYADQAGAAFAALPGQDVPVQDIVLPFLDTLYVDLVEKYLVLCTGNVFLGEAGWFAHPVTEVRMGPMAGTGGNLVSAEARYTPGKAVQDVFWQSQFSTPSGWVEEEWIPGQAWEANTPLAEYTWANLPAAGPETVHWGLMAADSALPETARAIPLSVTRSVISDPSATAYTVTVRVEATVNQEGYGTLFLDILDDDLPIADAVFDPSDLGLKAAGEITGGGGWSGETALPTGGFRLTIPEPQPGIDYSFEKVLIVTPLHNQGIVRYTPHARALLASAPQPLTIVVEGNTVSISDPATVGDLSVTPANEVVWDQALALRTAMEGVNFPVLASEDNAVRPEIALISPAPETSGAEPLDPVTITFTKPMMTESLYLRVEDDRGNVACDTQLGVLNGEIHWSAGQGPDQVLTFLPFAGLGAGSAWKVTVQAADKAGYPMAGQESWWFATGPRQDDAAAPRVMAVFPAPGANLPPAMERRRDPIYVTAVFSEAVDPGSLAERMVLERLDAPGGQVLSWVPGQVVYMGNLATFAPDASLAPGAPYRATLVQGVTDTAGLPMNAFSWEFTTGPADSAPWDFTSPVAGAVDMPLWNTMPVLYPGRELDASSLAGAVTVTNAAQEDLSAFFTPVWMGPSRGLALLRAPWAQYLPLDPFMEYTVTVGPGVLDASGNPPASVPFSLTFLTRASQGNSLPQINGVPALPLTPYPKVAATPEGVSLDLMLRAMDQDDAWPGDPLTARADLDGLNRTLRESPVTRGLFRYRTEDLPEGEPAVAGFHSLTYTVEDSAGHEVSITRPAVVMGGPVALDGPADGAGVAWPAVVSWIGLPGARAYQVTAYTAADLSVKAGAWLVPDDGRPAPYTLALPPDLPGDILFWRVTALADLTGPLAPTGLALSEVRSLSRDLAGPELIPVAPQDGDVGVDPKPAIQVLLSDPDSGVYTPSISLWVDVNQAGPQPVDPAFYDLDASDPFNVLLTFAPGVPFPPLADVVVGLDALDRSGNPMDPSPATFGFTVRDLVALHVPGDSATIAGALALATAGDQVFVGPGTYTENLVIGPGLSGIHIVTQGGPGQTVLTAADGDWPVILVEDAPGVEIRGFSITNGLAGIQVIGGSRDYLLAENDISGCGFGILVSADGPGRIENTVIHAGGEGIHVENEDTQDQEAPTPVIVNNTLAENLSGIVFGNSAPVILYNVVAGNTDWGIVDDPVGGQNPTLAGNDVFGNGPAGASNYAGLLPGVGDISADPLFVNTAEANYRLMPESPCVDAVSPAQANTPPAAPAKDQDQVVRPQGPGVDMGAFEMDLTFTSNPVTSATEEVPYEYKALAVGRGVTYGFAPGSGHPSDMWMEPAGSIVTWLPSTTSQAGTYSISLTATDLFGRTVVQDYILTVVAVNDPPPAPVPAPGGTRFHAMAGRPFTLTLNASDEETPVLTWTLANAPAGMGFASVGTGYANLSWVPDAANVNHDYPFTASVADGTASASSQPITITVLPPLAMTPDSAAPLLLGTDAVPVFCALAGGMPPYHVEATGSPVPTGTLAGLDGDGNTTREFSFVPVAGGQSFVRVTDSLGFDLMSGVFDVRVVQTFFLSGSPGLVPGEPYGFTVEGAESPLNGLTLTIPAGAVSEATPLSISEATDAPHLAEADGGFLQLGPEGLTFLEDLVVEYPYTGQSPLANLLAFTFDPVTGRWANIPITSVDLANGTVSFPVPHFSLYTVAEPSSMTLNLTGGDQPSNYRMVSIPAQPAATADMEALLGSAGNLGAYNQTRWRLFGFVPSSQWTGNPNAYYVEAGTQGFAESQPMEPGRAWWAISRANANVAVPGLATGVDQDFYLTLQPGWNMVGDPWAIAADWGAVQSSTDGLNFHPLGENSPLNPLYNPAAGGPEPLFRYDPEDPGAGPDGYVETTTMTPFDGFWVYNNAPSPAVLWFASGSMVIAKAEPAPRASKGFWARLASVRSVFADDSSLRRPPQPPGASGDNKGTVDNAIGVAGGSSSCFVRTAGKAPAWPVALFAVLALAALAARAVRMRRG